MQSYRAIFAVAAILVCASRAYAEDWKTTDGKVYTDVKVIRADADSVTIMHHDGGGRILMAKLPPDLQKRFNYDPEKAKLAAAERAKADMANRHRLQLEMNAAAEKRGVPSAPTVATTEADSPGNTVIIMDADATPHLGADPGDSSHHSINELADSAQTVRRDLSDPDYHTTGHMVYIIHQQGLGPDKSDPNHHSMDEIR